MARSFSTVSSPKPSLSNPRNLQVMALAVACAVLLAIVVRGWLPEPTSGLYFKAQRLEAAGQLDLALRHYSVLTRRHPESPYAPRALERQASIISGAARQKGDAAGLRRALDLYLQIAQVYPSHPLAGDALVTAGNLAFVDLKDAGRAKSIYNSVLQRYPNNREYASEATLKMGRIALALGDGPSAQRWLQSVLQRYPTMIERCAEAQYHLGVAYETLWTKAPHKEWAKQAYEATIKRYPQSVWALDARERLGMLYFGDLATRPRERRVQIEMPPLPEESALEDNDNGGLLAALRLLLAARGLEADNALLHGWSLSPFFAAFDPNEPGRVVAAPFRAFENIAANAGLRYSPTDDGSSSEALSDLQRELDDARPPLIFDGRWRLAVGYDSSRGQVFLQSGGARYETVGVKELATTWKQPSSIGGPFSMIAFSAPGDRPRTAKPGVKPKPRANLDASSEPTPVPTATPLPQFSSPTWIYQLSPLDRRAVHRRTLKRAATWMKRPRDGRALLNVEALSALARELDRLSKRPDASQSTTPAAMPTEVPTPITELPIAPETPDAESAAQETPIATDAPPALLPDAGEAAAARNLTRARALLSWFGTPLSNWIEARRDAAAYLDDAANALNNSNLQRAAGDFRAAIAALEAARDSLPTAEALAAGGDRIELSDAARAALAQCARQIERARDAERRAANAMNAA